MTAGCHRQRLVCSLLALLRIGCEADSRLPRGLLCGMDPTQGAALLPMCWRPWSARSRAAVAFLPGERAAAERIAQRLFGRALRLAEYAGLAGAPDDAKVEIGASHGRLYLELADPLTAAYCGYYYVFGRKAAVILLNDGFRIHLRTMRRQGLGLQMFYRQARNAAARGVDWIEALAGRRRDENGYYTWPRYGFDCPLPASIRHGLPVALKNSRTLLDMMSGETGRQWWQQQGTDVRVRFDLASGSRSRRFLAEYVRLRAGGAATVPDTAQHFV